MAFGDFDATELNKDIIAKLEHILKINMDRRKEFTTVAWVDYLLLQAELMMHRLTEAEFLLKSEVED